MMLSRWYAPLTPDGLLHAIHSLSLRQLELDEPTGPPIFRRMTLSYGLGEQHGLFSAMMKAAQSELWEGGDGL
jgi:hypothetical protein